jgi:DnaJ domain
MHEASGSSAPDPWVIWNGGSGLLATAALGRVEQTSQGQRAWMDRPFDMLGPFNLDELTAEGRTAFAACIVMSRQRWQADQAELRRTSFENRRAAQARAHAQDARTPWPQGDTHSERQHRETLNLPTEGRLEPGQIKKAYRRLAQKAHPDMGGSQAQFVRITEARNALLASWV